MERIVRWEPVEGPGLEHLRLTWGRDGARAEGVVLGTDSQRPFALRYVVAADAGWRTRFVSLELVGEGRALTLSHDGEGTWRDEAGRIVPEIAGCLDIDVSTTPFTNTLPIRRLDPAAGEARTIDAAFLRVPDLAMARAAQRYTCLERGRRYVYEGLASGFRVELSVDSDGLVVDYPRTFRRIPLPP